MADFPCLEVVTAGPHQLPVGHRVPLTSRFVLGRGAGRELQLQSGAISRAHCEVVFEHARWWVRDLGTTNGTWVRGERVHDAELLHGDFFELPWGVVFRLLLREPAEARDDAMERALGDDARTWAVYADWLHERGDPLGARITAPRPEDDARWLGPLAGFAGRGELQVEWAHGLPRALVLRSLATHHPEVSWEARLAVLQRHREFRFVRALTLDLGSFQRAPVQPADLARALDALDGSLHALEHVAVGPSSAVEGEELQTHLAALAHRHPRVRFELTTWRPAALSVEAVPEGLELGLPVGGRVALTSPFVVGPGPDARLALHSPGGTTLTLRFEDDRWRLEVSGQGARTAKLNARPLVRAQLRGGDLLEPYPGLLLRFLS